MSSAVLPASGRLETLNDVRSVRMMAADLEKSGRVTPGAWSDVPGMRMNIGTSCHRGRSQSKAGGSTGHEVHFVSAALDLLPPGF